MFNWEAPSSNSPPRIVSSYFWIYWAFTVPLTIIVAFSWRLWWTWEKRHLDQDVLLEIENIEETTLVNPRTQKGGNEMEVETGVKALRNAWQSLRRRNAKKVPGEKEI
jgi:hypothetical protein